MKKNKKQVRTSRTVSYPQRVVGSFRRLQTRYKKLDRQIASQVQRPINWYKRRQEAKRAHELWMSRHLLGRPEPYLTEAPIDIVERYADPSYPLTELYTNLVKITDDMKGSPSSYKKRSSDTK